MRRSRISIFSALVVGAVLAPATPALAGGDVTVMTRNLYLGADIIQLALPKTKNEFKKKATGMWKTVQKTNFPKRAPAPPACWGQFPAPPACRGLPDQARSSPTSSRVSPSAPPRPQLGGFPLCN